MEREKTFAVEEFTGALVELLEVFPSADGEHLGIRVSPPVGEPLSFVLPEQLMDMFVLSIQNAVRTCRRKQTEANDNLLRID
jgi:hypothetical protein